LVETLVVVGLLVLLIGLLAPALRTARPGKSAIAELKISIDRARSEAMRHGTECYIAFTDSLPSYEGNATTDELRYRQYAIFLRETANMNPAARYFPDVHTCPLKILQGWRTLPDGVMFALGRDIEVDSGARDFRTILDASDPEEELGIRGSGARVFPYEGYPAPIPCIAFNKEGRVRLPSWEEGETLYLGVVAGKVVDGQRLIIEFQNAFRGGQRVPVVDLLSISYSTGRVREVGVDAATPGPSLKTN